MSSDGHLHPFDPDFTDHVINATGPKASPRIRKVVGSLVQHLHDFMRENLVTMDEFMAAIELVSQSLGSC
jgi:catechol 1,2-dioxygenase